MKGPGIKEGLVIEADSNIRTIDIVPTVLHMMGFDIPDSGWSSSEELVRGSDPMTTQSQGQTPALPTRSQVSGNILIGHIMSHIDTADTSLLEAARGCKHTQKIRSDLLGRSVSDLDRSYRRFKTLREHLAAKGNIRTPAHIKSRHGELRYRWQHKGACCCRSDECHMA